MFARPTYDLTAIYEEWITSEGLERLQLGSADEHLFDERLTQAQREWLWAFCEEWEAAEAMELR